MNKTITHATPLITISNEDLEQVKVTKEKIDKIIITPEEPKKISAKVELWNRIHVGTLVL